jgi:hypothetical protein
MHLLGYLAHGRYYGGRVVWPACDRPMTANEERLYRQACGDLMWLVVAVRLLVAAVIIGVYLLLRHVPRPLL